MKLASAVRVFLAFLLSLPALKSNPDWAVRYTTSNVCALRGSTVNISCTYEYPYKLPYRSVPVRNLWFTDANQPDDLLSDTAYAGRVEYSCDEIICRLSRCEGTCTLRIKDLRKTDSASYKFRFITNQTDGGFTGQTGVTLSVTDLEVSYHNNNYLQCHSGSTCRLAGNPKIIWYRNGEYLSEGWMGNRLQINPYYDSYACAVEGYEHLHSPLQCVPGYSCNKVSYTTRTMCVLQGTSVDISCTYSIWYGSRYPVDKYWYIWRDNQQPRDLKTDSEYKDRAQYPEERKESSTLRITGLKVTDSAEYRFKFKTQSDEWKGTLHGTTLTVTGLSVDVTPVATVTEGQTVRLSCVTSCPLTDQPSYVWYKNNVSGSWLEKPNNQLVLDHVTPMHAGNYSCSIRRYQHLRSPEKQLTVQCTMYAPKTPSVTMSPSGEIEEGSSVTLSCSSDANPAANYAWFKVNTGNSSRVKSQGQQVVFDHIQSSNTGQYLCEAKNEKGTSSESISIDVKYGPKHTSVYSSPSGEIEEGSSVTLSCSSDANPAANYTWFKVNTGNSSRVKSQGQQVVFDHIQSSNTGQYLCEAKNEKGTTSESISIDVKYGPKHTSVYSSPSGEIEEGSSVTLSCSSDANPAANYTWFKEHEDSVGPGQNYTIASITSEHGGNYYCRAHNGIGRHNSTYLSIYVTVSTLTRRTAVLKDRTFEAVADPQMHDLKDGPLKVFSKSTFLSSLSLPPCQTLCVPVYDNVLAVTYRLAPSAQSEPMEQQDDLHYANIHISRAKNQEVPSRLAGSHVQSDQKEEVLYSVVNFKR
ncbi:unnamed protein product, partial [Lota lota]